MKKTIYVDVTDFVTWKGHFSGIQRVTYEVGIRLCEDKGFDVRYAYYNGKKKQFFEIQSDVFGEAQAARQQQLSQESPGEAAVADSESLSLVSRAKKLVKGAYLRLPEPTRKVVKRSYNKTRHRAGLVLNKVVRPTIRVIKDEYPVERVPDAMKRHMKPLVMGPGDTFMIIGQGWYKPSMIQELGKRKGEEGWKLALMIHDIIPVLYPETYDRGFDNIYNEFLFEGLIMADTVFAISQSTRRDIEAYCRQNYIRVPDVVLVREGDSFSDAQPVRPSYLSSNEDFVLAVGSFEIRKNYMTLYMAAKQAQLSGVSLPRIIIVGRKGYLSHNLTTLLENDYSLWERFSNFSGTNDAELSWLYENALFTVYPSVYEGWGLPIAESLHHGKFCISSNTSSMPEVGGDLAEYLDPYDVMGWMRAIHKYSTNKKLLAEKTQAVTSKFKAHSWDDTVRAIKSSL